MKKGTRFCKSLSPKLLLPERNGYYLQHIVPTVPRNYSTLPYPLHYCDISTTARFGAPARPDNWLGWRPVVLD